MEFDDLIAKLWKARMPTEQEVTLVLNTVKPILAKLPNLLELNAPTIICGDIHGHLFQLLHFFEVVGKPPEKNYLFLGDYCDRGPFAVEVLCLLFIYKIKYPKNINLLRGNHECRNVNIDYGFQQEITKKYHSNHLYDLFNSVFTYLPISAVVDKKYFCVHAGLGPELRSLDQIKKLNRCVEPELTGILSDLLWSDPGEGNGWIKSKRRSGYLFGEQQTTEFLQANKLTMVVRSHEIMDGFRYCHKKETFIFVGHSKLLQFWPCKGIIFDC